MEPRITFLLMALAAGGASSGESSDTALLADTAKANAVGIPAPVVPSPPDSIEVPVGAPDTVPVAAPVAKVVAPPTEHTAPVGTPVSQGDDWAVLVDLVDVDGGYRLNQRHFGKKSESTNLCCVDLAWTPWRPVQGLAVGASTNIGWWRQNVSDGTVLEVSDILLASSVKFDPEGTGLWARLDLGVSTLVVDRITVGVDWGVGGAARVGWRSETESVALVVGAGWDFRRYLHLDMKDVPAITLFAGVEW